MDFFTFYRNSPVLSGERSSGEDSWWTAYIVIILQDLRSIYQDRLKYLGAAEDMIKNANVTRLKE